MPTGYTAAIADGITFEQFAMNCAREFGALFLMREEPNNAVIPERFEPSDYHVEKIAEAKSTLESLKSISPDDAERRALDEYEREVLQNKEAIKKKERLKEKYEAMLKEAEAWIPPSEDHTGMKNFMISQIKESIDFDCDSSYYRREVPRLSGEEWINKNLKQALHDLDYHNKQNEEEIERTESRNVWLNKLRESLK